MKGYLGEKPVETKNTKYANYSKADWAVYWIEMYGGIDRAHHKDWVLDHVARILKGSKIQISEATWEGGHSELRFRVEASKEYLDWVETFDGDYDEGIAP